MQKTIIAVAAAAFVVIFGWGASTADGLDWAAFTADPWVAVGMADLTLGFVLMSVVIATVEGSLLRAAPWIVALFIVGNLVSAIYLILHFDRLAAPFAAMKEKPE